MNEWYAMGEAASPLYLTYLGNVAAAEGQLDEARTLFQQALDEGRAIDFPLPIGLGLHGLARVATEQGDGAPARVLYEEALDVLRAVGNMPQMALPRCVRRGQGARRRAAGRRSHPGAGAGGRTSQGVADSRGRGEVLRPEWTDSSRARRCHAGGAATPISASPTSWLIGKRTVEMHVGNLFAKLGITSRTELALWAAAHDSRGASRIP